MTTFEMIQKLAEYPPDTPLVNGYDWADPQLAANEYDGVLTVAIHSGEMAEP